MVKYICICVHSRNCIHNISLCFNCNNNILKSLINTNNTIVSVKILSTISPLFHNPISLIPYFY